LHDDMGVTNDLATSVERLGCSETVLLGVHEVAGSPVRDGKGDSEGFISRNGIAVLGDGKFARWDVIN
jgi:hypothetical protein